MSQWIQPLMFQLTWFVAILGMLTSVHADEFFCSSGNVTCLIAAINESNQNGRTNTIHLEPGTYSLTSIDNFADGISGVVGNGLPSITGKVTIQGAGAENTIIERATDAAPFRLIHVGAGGSLETMAVTLQGGGSDAAGGAVFNRGILKVRSSILMRNRAGEGGALSNVGEATVENSFLVANTSRTQAGAISNEGKLTLSSSSIDDNNAGFRSGGIFNTGTLIVNRSTLSRNSSEFIGALENNGTATIANSTIGSNLAVFSGAGVVNAGTLALTNSTVAFNNSDGGPGGASGLTNGGSLTVQNSIIAHNRLGFVNDNVNCVGNVTSLGHNLFDPTGCTTPLPTDLIAEPGLGEFVDDESPGGGHLPLLAGSPAIDAADPAACPPIDQLGNPRLGICDIGSVEFQGGRLLVAIDIRTNGNGNGNSQSQKNVNVVVFSINGFDAGAINLNTIRFGATGSEAAPVHAARRDVDGDGRRDMVLRFQIANSGIQCGDVSAVLTGETSTGQAFVGSGPITTTECHQEVPALTVKPNVKRAGGSVNAKWSGIAAPTSTDWIGLYVPGAANTSFIDWVYLSCTKTPGASRSSGSCEFVLPAWLDAGTYELRLLAQDGFTALAVSSTLTVTAGRRKVAFTSR